MGGVLLNGEGIAHLRCPFCNWLYPGQGPALVVDGYVMVDCLGCGQQYRIILGTLDEDGITDWGTEGNPERVGEIKK